MCGILGYLVEGTSRSGFLLVGREDDDDDDEAVETRGGRGKENVRTF